MNARNSKRVEHLTFKDLKANGIFATGPSENLFLKLDNEGAENLDGGYAVDLSYPGKKVWVPANRVVLLPKKKHFVQLAHDYRWNQICARAE